MMKPIHIDCPSCQQPMEINAPEPKNRTLPIIFGSLALLGTFIVWPTPRYDYSEIVFDPSPSITNRALVVYSDKTRSTNDFLSLSSAVSCAALYGWEPIGFTDANTAIMRRPEHPWQTEFRFYTLNERNYSLGDGTPRQLMTNWEYKTLSATDDDGYDLSFFILKDEVPGIPSDGAVEHSGAIEEPEPTILDYMGERGWELTAARLTGHRMTWTFKRPKK